MIEVYSLDFDGCLANYLYLSEKNKDILAANQFLLKVMASSSNKKIVFVGSNRQGLSDDYVNSFADERGSCYPAIQLISEVIGASLDYLLLADIFNDLPSGSSFLQALEYIALNNRDYTERVKEKELPNWIHDESKLSLIYAQMHKTALENPKEQIQFNFIDDREDLLNDLHAYFTKYPESIPKNVTLNLKRYVGPIDKSGVAVTQEIIDYTPIQGKGTKPDSDYRHTVKMMAAVTIEKKFADETYVFGSRSKGPISTYEQAKENNFDVSASKFIRYYEPGMRPVNLPEKTKRYSADKKAKSIAKLPAFRFSLPNPSLSSSSPASSISNSNPDYEDESINNTPSSSSSGPILVQTKYNFFPAQYPKPDVYLNLKDIIIGDHRRRYSQANLDKPSDSVATLEDDDVLFIDTMSN